MRLEGKVAIVVGAGQTPGETIGNGRATAIRFAQEGAKVLAVDKDEISGAETVRMIEREGGSGSMLGVDIVEEKQNKAISEPFVIQTLKSCWIHCE